MKELSNMSRDFTISDEDSERFQEELVKTIQNKEEFNRRVGRGESPDKVAKELGITLAQPL